MFERFRTAFGLGAGRTAAAPPWLGPRLRSVPHVPELMAELAGATLGGGLYRIHDQSTGSSARALVAEAFPELAARAEPFGYDWLGRQHVLDWGRMEAGAPLVTIVEPGFGQWLEVPVGFAEFHESEIVDETDAVLAVDLFRSWAATEGASLPLGRDECVAYRVPPMLGGPDTLENLEVSGIDLC
jgi:hypothetical protein